MSNLSFARIMYGTSPEQQSPSFGPMSNFPSVMQSAVPGTSQTSEREARSATVQSILHKLWMVLSEKK